jgi:hypothetical protein
MTKKLLFVATILFVVTFVAMAADPSGKWTYQQPGRGGEMVAVTIELKYDGTTLTGTVPAFGRGPIEISNARVDGDKIYFEVHRGSQNGERVSKYEGTVSGDEMKLKVTSPGRGGGEPMTNEFSAKREKS